MTTQQIDFSFDNPAPTMELMQSWVKLVQANPELTHAQKVVLTKNISEFSGRDLLAEGILLNGIVSFAENGVDPADTQSITVDVTVSFEAIEPLITEPTFMQELERLINKHSQENGSNTPDFILANYLKNCLGAFNDAVESRELWYGRKPAEASIETIEQLSQHHKDIADNIAGPNGQTYRGNVDTSDLEAISDAVRERAVQQRSFPVDNPDLSET